MKKRQTKQHDISALAGLLLLGVFAVCILSVLLTGAQAYRRLTERDNAVLEQRSRVQYVATRVRQTPGEVRVESFGGGDALVLPEDINGETYVTRVYCYDGWLMELFTPDGNGYAPEDGEKLLAAKALELDLADGLLSVTVVGPDDSRAAQTLALRTEAEVTP